MGAILLMEAPILEGPRGQNLHCCIADLVDSESWPVRDVAACRSDPTFTRASPGLAVAEQLPQIRVNFRVDFKVGAKKIQGQTKKRKKHQAERSALSESPGRETPTLKI